MTTGTHPIPEEGPTSGSGMGLWQQGRPRSLVEAYDRVAGRSPESIAVKDGRVEWTYERLAARSRAVADWLHRLGLGRGAVVGLVMDRSVETIGAILGILRAGACYLPVDPAAPPARVIELLDGGGARAIITEASMVHRVPNGQYPLAVIESLPDDAVFRGQGPESGDFAYLIHTSGSSGQPKGVAIRHEQVLGLIEDAESLLAFGAGDTWTLFHSFAFDFSVWEMWGALLGGGTLLLVPWVVSRDPLEFHQWLARGKVTVLSQTPSAFLQLLRAEEELGPCGPDLRLVVLGGEAVDFSSLRPWFEARHHRDVELLNGYGVTEATVFSTFRRISAGDLDCPSLIGRPLAGVTISVRQEDGRETRYGEPGELWLHGSRVAGGYWKQPALTREHFLTDAAGRPTYRTGDRVRINDAGDLEYLGRLDAQIQWRGYRIEPGEIESALLRCPGVTSAAAVLAGAGADSFLAAAVCGTDGRVDTELCRARLAEMLPPQMVPAQVKVVGELPLTANGKLDRAAVARQFNAPPPPSGSPHSPRALVEAMLGRALRAGEESIPLVRLGLDSFQLARLSASLRRLHNRRISIGDLLGRTGTIGAVEREIGGPRGSESPATDARPSEFLPMTTGQMETLLRSGLDAASAPVFNECLVIRLPGAAEIAALDRALARLAVRHPLLRGVPDAAQARWLVGSVSPRWETLEAHDEAAARRLIDVRIARPLGSPGSPPAVFLHLPLAGGGTLLAFLAHHCILDGWSASVFHRELAECYRAEAKGGAPVLPEPDDIARFIAGENETEKAALANQRLRAFWENRCRNLPAMRWPGSPVGPSPAADHVNITIPAATVERIRAASRKGGRTEFTHWLGTHLLWLHWLCRQDDLVAGIPLAAQAATGRPDLLGHGTRFLPVRSRRIPTMTARGFLNALAVEIAEVIHHGELTAGAMTPWLDREAIRAGQSLLPTAFSLVPELAAADFGDAGTSEAVIHPRTHVSMPVAAWLQAKDGGLELDLAYQRGAFNARDFEIWAEAWPMIAEEIASRPDLPLDHLPLPDAPARAALASGPPAAPRSPGSWTPTARRVAEIWSELIGQKINSPGADFFASGGHSLLALRFFSRWHRETGTNAPLATLLNFPVLGDLAAELDRLGGPPPADTEAPVLPAGFARLRGGGDAPPLLFLHAGDGGVIFSRDIARDLPARHPVFAIESPHLAGQALPEAVGVEVMAARYLESWDSVGIAVPPVLIGYSFGGVVAWEMAARLAQRGKAPALVVLIDTHNPEMPLRAHGLAKRMRVFWRQNRRLPVGARFAALLRRALEGAKNHFRIRSEIRRANADPTGEFRTVRLRELHEAAMFAYRPPDYAGPVALLKAASSGDKFELPADYHWSKRARGTFTILEVPGDHLGILEQENLPALAGCLARLLASSLPPNV